MDQSMRSVMGQLVEASSSLEGSLAQQLAYIADQIRAMNPSFSDAVDAFVDRLSHAQAGEQAPNVGDQMPSFLLPDDQGGQIASVDYLSGNRMGSSDAGD